MYLFILILVLIIPLLDCMFVDLSNHVERCFIEELFADSVIMIDYKVFTFENDKELFIKNNIDDIYIRIYDEAGTALSAYTLNNYKDKITFSSKVEAYYRICVETIGGTLEARSKIYFRLRIIAENSLYEPDTTKAAKTDDIEKLQQDLRWLIKKGDKVIKYQENTLDDEDKIALLQMKDSRLYYGMTVLQIIVISIVFVCNLYNFIKIIR
jgi:hypothetical protein